MLPRRKRVGRQLFSLIFKKGAVAHSSHLSLKTLPVEGEGRFSVAVEKNFSRASAERNRVRRQGYALLLRQLPVWPEGVSGVFFIKKKAPTALLEEELSFLLRRAKLK